MMRLDAKGWDSREVDCAEAIQIHTHLCYATTMLMLSPKTEALARELADVHQLSVDTVIRRALEAATVFGEDARPAKNMSAAAIAERTARSFELLASIASLPVLDPRTPAEIIDDLNQP